MSQLSQFKINWKPRDFPLPPLAVAAKGEASLRLAQRLLQFDDESLNRLEGVAGKQLLVIHGPADLLPWVEGVQYLGIDKSDPSVFFPTNYEPSLPHELLASAFVRKAGPGAIAVLPDPLLLVPMREARPISRQTLEAWLGQP